jgi:hypothetical protein
MRALVHAAHWLLTGTLFTLAVLIALRNLRLTRHAVGEALGARVAALVLLVVPVVAAAVVSPALAVLVVLAGSTPFLRRRESRTLGAVCLMLALVDGGMRLFAPHALLLDARTRTAKIAHLNDAGHDGALERQLAAEARRPAEVELVLGLQARRRGDSATAQQRFVAALRADSTCAAAYVNLANLFFREGSYERAATGYRAAQALEPELPLSYANLAQTYIRMTKYAESDHELRAASDRGIAVINQRRGLWRDEAQPVFDATLQRETLLALAAAELDAVPSLRHTVLQTWRSRPWRHFPPVVAIVLLAVTGGILLWTPRLSRIAVCCPECGIVMCTHCVAMSPLDDRCNPCQIARPRPRAPGAEVISTDRRRRLSLATGRWVAPLFPGSADLVRGAPVAATFAIAAAWIMLGVAALGIEIARLRSEAWYVATDARLLQAAATAVGILWLPGLFRLRARERNVSIVVRRAPQTGA